MIIISMDSHTELVANLKPFLPHRWHAEFDEGEVLARHYFAKVIESFSPFVAAGNNLSEVGFTALPIAADRLPSRSTCAHFRSTNAWP